MNEALSKDPPRLQLMWVLLGCILLSVSIFFIGFLAGFYSLRNFSHVTEAISSISHEKTPPLLSISEKKSENEETSKYNLLLGRFSQKEQAEIFLSLFQKTVGICGKIISKKEKESENHAVNIGPYGLEDAHLWVKKLISYAVIAVIEPAE